MCYDPLIITRSLKSIKNVYRVDDILNGASSIDDLGILTNMSNQTNAKHLEHSASSNTTLITFMKPRPLSPFKIVCFEALLNNVL